MSGASRRARSRRFGRPRLGWNPADFGTVAFDWDFSNASSVTLNGSDVSAIACSAGTGRDLQQTTASLQPAYTGETINGRQCANFNSHLLVDDTWPSDVASAKHSIWLMTDAASGPALDDYYFDSQGTGARLILGQNRTTDGVAYFDGAAWRPSGTAGTTGAQLITFQLDSATVSEVFRDGVSIGTDAYADTAISAITGIGLGGPQSGGVINRILTTKIGRMLCISPAVSTASAAEIDALMLGDWGL